MLTFELERMEELKAAGAYFDAPAICMGPDKLPRVAAHARDKSVWLFRPKGLNWAAWPVARAAKDGGSQSLPVVDVYGISVASSTVADCVTGRGRTKGMGNDTFHGPWLTVVPAGQGPGPIQFVGKGFSAGAVRCIFDTPEAWRLELWSKNGAWTTWDVRGSGASKLIARGDDRIGATGEHLARVAGGWMAFGGSSTYGDSMVKQRGGQAARWMDCDVYPEAGSDVFGYVGMGTRVNAGKTVVYLGAAPAGQALLNKVVDGVALFCPGVLPSMGPADRMDRHGIQFAAVAGKMAAAWTCGGEIMLADADAAVARVAAPTPIQDGSLAAMCKGIGNRLLLALVTKGKLFLCTVKVKKVVAGHV